MEIIAEIGQNHNGDIGLAKELIYSVKDSGADVAKFQLFDMNFWEKIYDNNPEIKQTWQNYHQKTCLSNESIVSLIELCDKLNIEFMCSVFNEHFIDFVENFNVKRYKLASNSIFNKNLLNKLIQTNKELIISLGHWKKNKLPNFKSKNKISYLYCISNYPTKFDDLNFNKIDFNKYDGFSDHTIGLDASYIALSRGAKIIEKHITLDKKMEGPDHEGSITPNELKKLVKFKNNLILSL